MTTGKIDRSFRKITLEQPKDFFAASEGAVLTIGLGHTICSQLQSQIDGLRRFAAGSFSLASRSTGEPTVGAP
jgi:hypothetical protein